MDNDISISLCMIVKNEEDTLRRCLSSVKGIVNEIIIIDTGSTDKTKEIAREFQSELFDFEWIEDFSAARNYAFSKASKDYILWLDADDYLDEDNIEKIKNLKKNLDKKYDSITMDYSLTRDEKGNTIFSLKRNRLVKRVRNFKWIGRVHEYLEVYGLIYNSNITVNHGKLKKGTDRNLRIFKKMIEDNVEFSARDRFYYSNELYYNSFYKEAINNYEMFLSLPNSWIEDKKIAFNNMAECYIYLNDKENLINTLFKLLKEAAPTGEICCKLGDYFTKEESVEQAIFWYKAALECIPSKNNLSYNNRDYYTWIPAINLSLSYYNLKDYDKAYYYNELAASYGFGNNEKITHNREFYKKMYLENGLTLPTINL